MPPGKSGRCDVVDCLRVRSAPMRLFRVQLERTLGAKRSHLDKAATFRRLRIGGPLGTDALADVADAPPYASASRTHASAYRSRWYRSGLARRCCLSRTLYRFCNAQLMYITVSTVPVVHMLYDSTTLSSMVVGTIMLVHSTEYRVP